MHTEKEKAVRRERVGAAKDALARSARMDGPIVAQARKTLRDFLRQLDQQRQPTDAAFQEMIDAPFRQPPPRRNW